MRLLRSLLVMAGLAGAVLALRALLGGRSGPASYDTWPPVPKKVPATS